MCVVWCLPFHSLFLLWPPWSPLGSKQCQWKFWTVKTWVFLAQGQVTSDTMISQKVQRAYLQNKNISVCKLWCMQRKCFPDVLSPSKQVCDNAMRHKQRPLMYYLSIKSYFYASSIIKGQCCSWRCKPRFLEGRMFFIFYTSNTMIIRTPYSVYWNFMARD